MSLPLSDFYRNYSWLDQAWCFIVHYKYCGQYPIFYVGTLVGDILSIIVSNHTLVVCWHYNKQSCNNQMVLLLLESWSSQWCHPVRGVGYHEYRWFSWPVEQASNYMRTLNTVIIIVSTVFNWEFLSPRDNCNCLSSCPAVFTYQKMHKETAGFKPSRSKKCPH